MAALLTYHKIGRQRELGITTVGRRRLAGHLDFLVETGRTLVNASAAVRAGSDGGAVGITFDDGYESVYTDAFPELSARQIPATVFPVVGSVGSTNVWDVRLSLTPARHLSWGQIEELARWGVEFGSHTMTHRDLTALSAAGLREELAASRRVLEDHTGKPVRAVAYPFGKCDRRVIEAAREAGYDCGFTSSPGGGGAGAASSSMAVGRMSVYCLDGRRSLTRKIGAGAAHRLEALKNRGIARLSRGTILVKRWRWGLP